MSEIEGMGSRGWTVRYGGWRAVWHGGPYMECYCPHGKAVEVVNYWDYKSGAARSGVTRAVMLTDLAELVNEATDGGWIDHYCYH